MQTNMARTRGNHHTSGGSNGTGPRKIVKPAKKWRTATNKPKEVRPSADTNQRTSAASSLKIVDKVQTRSSRIFRFGSAAKEVTETGNSPIVLQELPRHQDCAEDRGLTKKTKELV